MGGTHRDDGDERDEHEREQQRVEERGARERHGELVLDHRLQQQTAPAQVSALRTHECSRIFVHCTGCC